MGHLVCIVVGLIRDQSDRGLRFYAPVTDRPRCPNIDRVWDKIFSIVGHNTGFKAIVYRTCVIQWEIFSIYVYRGL